MKSTLIIGLVVFVHSINVQSIDFNQLFLGEANYFSSQSNVQDLFGNPIRITEPNYDCGLLSSIEQGIKIISLEFPGFTFTGEENGLLVLESIDLTQKIPFPLKYGNVTLDKTVGTQTLARIFKLEKYQLESLNEKGVLVLYAEGRDDGIILKVENNRLIQVKYLTPC